VKKQARQGKAGKTGKVSQEPLLLGIDLGGTKILSAVVSARGEIISRDRSATPSAGGTEAILRALLDSASSALGQAALKAADLVAIGVGAAGFSDPETGILYTSPHLPRLKDAPLRDVISRETGVETFLINDASAAALGEYLFGAGRKARHFIYVTVSTGIGGGIVINGELYTGATGGAGEIGHMSILHDGPPCSCGGRGCWETLASGTALAREAQRAIESGAPTSILAHAGGELSRVTAREVHAAALRGDALAEELISRTGYYLGVGLANLLNIFNPELVIVGGGLTRLGDRLLTPAIKTAGERAFPRAFRAARFAAAALGGDSGVLGAAAYALQRAGGQPGPG